MLTKIKRYLWNILIWLDQGLNTLTGGDPDETVSSRVGKYIRDGRNCVLCKALCWFLNLIDKNHCAKNIEEDEGKNALNGRY